MVGIVSDSPASGYPVSCWEKNGWVCTFERAPKRP
jgi:hypothetical protein